MILVRHRDEGFHDLLGFGIVLEDFGYKALIRWIYPKSKKHTKHVMYKRALYYLDPNQKDCVTIPEINYPVRSEIAIIKEHS